MEPHVQQKCGQHSHPQPRPPLHAVKGLGGVVVQDRQHHAVKDRVHPRMRRIEHRDEPRSQVEPQQFDPDRKHTQEQKHAAHARLPAGCHGENEQDQKVRVLFHCQAPRVRDAADVVLDVQQIAPERVHAAVPAGNDEEKEHVVLRPDFETAPDEKAFAVDAPLDPPLLHQQAAHQEAAEDEEDVHAGGSEVLHMEQTQWVVQQPIRGIVVIQHQQNGDAAQEIQLNLAPERLSRLLGAHAASIENTPLRSAPPSRKPRTCAHIAGPNRTGPL